MTAAEFSAAIERLRDFADRWEFGSVSPQEIRDAHTQLTGLQRQMADHNAQVTA